MQWHNGSWSVLLIALTTFGCSSAGSGQEEVFLSAEPRELIAKYDERKPEVEIETEIRNLGKEAVPLSSIQSSCTCTIIREGVPSVLAAKGRFRLKLKVQPPRNGEKRVGVTVSPATGTPLQISVRLIGTPIKVPFVTHCPTEIQLVGHSADRTAESTLTVTTVEPAGDNHWLSDIQSDSSALSAKIESVQSQPREPGNVEKTYSIRLTSTLANVAGAQVRTQLTFQQTQSAEQPPPIVYVVSLFEPPIIAIPQQLLMPHGSQPLEKWSASVTLVGEGNNDWKVTAVLGVPEGMTHEVVRVKDGVFRIQFEWNAGRSALTNVGNRLEIETTHPESKSVVVPIRVQRRDDQFSEPAASS